MARFAASIRLLAVLALHCLHADAVAQTVPVPVASRGTEASCEHRLPPGYFGEPLLQDLRYLLAFALGYAFMRIIDTRERDCIPIVEEDRELPGLGNTQEQHLQINPLLLM